MTTKMGKDMKTNYELVREFQSEFNAPLDQTIDKEGIDFRWDRIEEEWTEVQCELVEAEFDIESFGYVTDSVRTNLLKELCDLLYVVYGTAATFGMDIDGAFKEVHRSNMSKLGDDGKPIKRADGKILKGNNYTVADVREFIG